ncbi:dimethyl sulfoxide reductase anchor subunit [Bacillus sp. Bva_UNVM-123]|uniref:dimethyl sulfoxide reductase anchor subunit family protein n=1 Tax=Bacillus sp. Bva_UNVM-123 TaxID=2829798 RepID=UPI00391F1FC9
MLHLGYPYKSYLSITGLQHSWLSREIIAVIAFNAVLAVFTWIWWKHISHSSLRKWFGTLSSVIGVAMIFVSAQVYYQMPIHQTWHSWTTIASFILTGVMIGTVYIYYFISRTKEGEHPLQLFSILISGVLILMIIVFGVYSQNLFNGIEAASAASLTLSSSLFWVRIVFSLIVPASLLLYLFKSKKPTHSRFAFMTALLVIVGEFSGRLLFYYTVMSQQPWF